MTRGRAPLPAADIVDVPMSAQALQQHSNNANQLVALNQEQDALVRATAAQLGYQLPADATDPDLIQRDIAANMRRSVEACLEVGRGLTVLKAACPHGQFMSRLEVMNIEGTVAVRFMQAARKFSNPASTQLLKAVGNQTKLFEMLVLDDETLEELALTGQTGELSLDDVATMSVKELRAAVREVRQEHAAVEKVLADKQTHINKLERTLKKQTVALTDWPAAFAPMFEQASAAMRQIEKGFSDLREITKAAHSTVPEPGEEDTLETAFVAIATALNDAYATAEKRLEDGRNFFGKTMDAWTPPPAAGAGADAQ